MKRLDIHGSNSFESEALIKSFLKECYISKQYFCLIIHGEGELILLKKTKILCSESKYVSHHEISPYSLGGLGATLVYIKKDGNV